MQGNQTAASPSAIRRHGRDSSELDVFDARRYFSGGTDAGVGFHRTVTTTSHRPAITAKIFDPPVILETKAKESPSLKDKSKKKFKQPVSPGVMLASFFYSFFPTSSKKKTKEKSLPDVEPDERWRRSSRRSSSALTLEAGSRKSKFDQALWKQRRGETTTKKTMIRPIRNGEEEKRKEDDCSDSSSDLFELKSFDLGATSFELPVFGSATGAGGFRRRKSSSHSVVF